MFELKVTHLRRWPNDHYYQYSGRFIKSHSEIAETSLLYLSEQLEVPVTDIDDYDWDGRSGKRHRTEILSFLGINRLSEPVKESFSKWLVNEIYPQRQTIPEAINLAYNWFKNHQTESLIDAVLNRLARAAFNQHENRLFGKIIRSLPTDAKEKMDLCLEGGKEVVEFTNLKADPGRVGLESVLNETEKLQFIRSLCLPKNVFQSISSKNMKRYYNRISGETAWEVKRHPQEIKYSLLAIFLYFRHREIIDGLIELFIQMDQAIKNRFIKLYGLLTVATTGAWCQKFSKTSNFVLAIYSIVLF